MYFVFMTFAFKLILLISFMGLVVIVARNRFANPQMRIQFLEDLEMNKKRLRFLGTWLWQVLHKISRFLVHAFQAFSPRVKQGSVWLLEKLQKSSDKVKTQVASQMKELHEDMKSLEIPGHKKDFFERLEGQEESQNSQEPKEPAPIAPPVIPKRLLGERFFANSFLSPVQPPKALQEPFQEKSTEVPVVREHAMRGFHVTELREQHIISEVEIDKTILMKKEKWLLYAILKNPKNANFYKKLGRIYLQLNNREDARNCFEYAVQLGSQDPEVKALLSQLRHSNSI